MWKRSSWKLSLINTTRLFAISSSCTVSDVQVRHIRPTETMQNYHSRGHIYKKRTNANCSPHCTRVCIVLSTARGRWGNYGNRKINGATLMIHCVKPRRSRIDVAYLRILTYVPFHQSWKSVGFISSTLHIISFLLLEHKQNWNLTFLPFKVNSVGLPLLLKFNLLYYPKRYLSFHSTCKPWRIHLSNNVYQNITRHWILSRAD
jgi:hypothetical protein